MIRMITRHILLLSCLCLVLVGAAAVSALPSERLEKTNLVAESENATSSASTLYLPLISKPLTLSGLVTVTDVTLPASLEGTAGSWCTWGGCSIGPRLYHSPLPNGGTLIGWTDQQGNGHVSLVNGSSVTHWNYAGTAVRGLVAHADNSFAVTLWNSPTETIYLSRRTSTNGEIWTTNMNSAIGEADFWLGDGRLDYGDGRYAAYFTVQGIPGQWAAGHHGDQLSYVGDNGAVQSGGWDWGCSHSMAQLVSYHPALNEFAAVCSSDCYPDKSIHWVDAGHQIYKGDGNCGGLVSTQLGQMALNEVAWKLVFNAQDQPCCDGNGIALATLDSNQQSSYVWLTNTNGAYERDPVIARIGTDLGSGRYLVGWMMLNDNSYWLGVINDNGQFLFGPENVTAAGIRWGNRDDSFRTRPDGTVSWLRADPNSSTIRLFQFNGDVFLP